MIKHVTSTDVLVQTLIKFVVSVQTQIMVKTDFLKR